MANDDVTARLKTFALIIKTGHDIFNAKDFDDAALKAVNDTKVLLNFRSAALFIRQGKNTVLAAQSGIPEKNSRSALAIAQQEFISELPLDNDVVIPESLPEALAVNDAAYLLLKLPRPERLNAQSMDFVLLLDYEKSVPAGIDSVVRVLGSFISDALYFHKSVRSKSVRLHRNWGKTVFWGIILAAVAALMMIKVPQTVTAEFTLRPQQITPVYAVQEGVVAECLYQDGQQVKAGDVIARYDTGLLTYRLEQSRSELQELEAEIALEERNAFTNAEKLGKVQLLNARKKVLEVSVKEAQWFLDHSEIKAPVAGMLVISNAGNGKLDGRAFRTGDKMFEIYSENGVIAEIPVDEKVSSILSEKFDTTLFLHTAPEHAIAVNDVQVPEYPEFTDQKTYCYMLRGNIVENNGQLRYGMRGIAKLAGGKVRLGYRLFKSAVLYFRGL